MRRYPGRFAETLVQSASWARHVDGNMDVFQSRIPEHFFVWQILKMFSTKINKQNPTKRDLTLPKLVMVQ